MAPISIDLEEDFEIVAEYEPTDPPGDDEDKTKEAEELAATYQDECTSSGDESREVREMKRLEREEKRRREEETTEAGDDEELEKMKGLRRPKKPVESPSKKRRKRKKKLEDAKNQQIVEEQSVPQSEGPSISSMTSPDEDHKRKRDTLLDDLPDSIRSTIRRRLEERAETTPEGEEVTVTPEEKEAMCAAFLAERVDTYTKHNKRTELNPQKMKSQLYQFSEKEIEEAMQKAVEKEIGTWQRFDAIDIIPPDESQKIRKKNPEKVISSRGVWTKKDDEKRDENEKEELVLKCRVVGRGFQEEYDEDLRRDSPTGSNLLVQVICSLAASRLMELTAADVRGAFLQGLKIDRELYFEPPKNLGKAKVPGVAPGSLLKLKKSIYGVNDAARQWYHSIKGILLRLGWESLTFELAGFVLRDPTSKEVMAILALHVDDVLIAWDEKKHPKERQDMICKRKCRRRWSGDNGGQMVPSRFAVNHINKMKMVQSMYMHKSALTT